MESVTGTTAKGIKCKFNVLGHYNNQEDIRKKLLNWKGAKAAVSYTTVTYDNKETKYDEYGREHEYNYGYCGNQDITYFADLKEADETYKALLKLTPKISVKCYCDIWLIKK